MSSRSLYSTDEGSNDTWWKERAWNIVSLYVNVDYTSGIWRCKMTWRYFVKSRMRGICTYGSVRGTKDTANSHYNILE